MKVCLCSDVHGCISLLFDAVERSRAELVIFAGDLVEQAGNDLVRAKRLLREFLEYCDRHPHVSFAVVSGNHDKQLEIDFQDATCDNLTYLCASHPYATVRGVGIAGQYGDKRLQKTPLSNAEILVFHKEPDADCDVLGQYGARLLVYGDNHRTDHSPRREHPGKAVKLDVSSGFRNGRGKFGYYSVDWSDGPMIAVWNEIDSKPWSELYQEGAGVL